MKAHKINGRVAVTGNLGDSGLALPRMLSSLLLPVVSFPLSSETRAWRTRSLLGLQSSHPLCSLIRKEQKCSLFAPLKRITGRTLTSVLWGCPLPRSVACQRDGRILLSGSGSCAHTVSWRRGSWNCRHTETRGLSRGGADPQRKESDYQNKGVKMPDVKRHCTSQITMIHDKPTCVRILLQLRFR